MKKYIHVVLSLIIISVLTLVGCGDTSTTSTEASVDALSQKMMGDIDSIGEVTLDDEQLVEKLIDRYATLTDSQKEQIENYTVLLEAEDKLDELKASEQASDVDLEEVEKADNNTEETTDEKDNNNEKTENNVEEIEKSIEVAEKSTEDIETSNTDKEQSTDVVEKSNAEAESNNVEITYIGNANTMKFHRPSCASVDQMKPKNKVEFTCTREEIISQGYVPCKNCKP